MKTADIARVVATIKFVPIYTCKCGVRQTGDTRWIEIDTLDAADLATVFEKLRHTAHAMPVGWSSHSNTGDAIFCPSCKPQ
jgi:hypothetical protein